MNQKRKAPVIPDKLKRDTDKGWFSPLTVARLKTSRGWCLQLDESKAESAGYPRQA
ncbi:hypothetical protein [Bacillus sp. 1P06AnD]|uniref:hypothetical protein n=1 Tax=Bacillus sp. 1P06AnD TaxID=3132208 RepID=UPI00399FCDB2